VDLTRLASML